MLYVVRRWSLRIALCCKYMFNKYLVKIYFDEDAEDIASFVYMNTRLN